MSAFFDFGFSQSWLLVYGLYQSICNKLSSFIYKENREKQITCILNQMRMYGLKKRVVEISSVQNVFFFQFSQIFCEYRMPLITITSVVHNFS